MLRTHAATVISLLRQMPGEVVVILHHPPSYPLPQCKSPIVACVSITRRYERLVEAEAKLKQVQDEKQQLETHMSAMLKAWEVRVSTVTRTNISAKAHFARSFFCPFVMVWTGKSARVQELAT